MDGNGLRSELKALLDNHIDTGALVLAGNFTASIFHPSHNDRPQILMRDYLKGNAMLKTKQVAIKKNDKMGYMKGAAKNIDKGYELILKEAAEKLEFQLHGESPDIIFTKTNKADEKISFSEGVKSKLIEAMPLYFKEAAKRTAVSLRISNFAKLRPTIASPIIARIPGLAEHIKTVYGEGEDGVVNFLSELSENGTEVETDVQSSNSSGGGRRSRRRRGSKRNKTRKNRNKSKPKSKYKNRKKNSKGRKSKRSRR